MDKVSANYSWADIIKMSKNPSDIILLSALHFSTKLGRNATTWGLRYTTYSKLTHSVLENKKLIFKDSKAGIYLSSYRVPGITSVVFNEWYWTRTDIPDILRACRIYLESIVPPGATKWVPKAFVNSQYIADLIKHKLITEKNSGFSLN